MARGQADTVGTSSSRDLWRESVWAGARLLALYRTVGGEPVDGPPLAAATAMAIQALQQYLIAAGHLARQREWAQPDGMRFRCRGMGTYPGRRFLRPARQRDAAGVRMARQVVRTTCTGPSASSRSAKASRTSRSGCA